MPPRTPMTTRAVALLASCLAFTTWFFIGFPPASDSLDLSWTTVMSWGIANQLQWGKDLVFTFGPLGFLYPASAYYADTVELFLAAQAVTGALWALLIFCFTLRSRPIDRVFLLLLLLIWFPFMAWDVGYYFAFVIGAAVVYRSLEHTRIPWIDATGIVSACLLLSILALTKFSFLLLWFTFFALLLSLLMASGRRAATLASAAILPLTLLVEWLLAGQEVASVPAYLVHSFEMAAGYAAAMSHAPTPIVDVVGLCVLLVCLIVVAGTYFRRRIADMSFGLFLGCVVILAWKSGYTRADGHIVIFFAVAACALVGELSLPDSRLGAAAAWFRRLIVTTIFAIGTMVAATVVLGESGRDEWNFTTLTNRWNWRAPLSMTALLAQPQRLLEARESQRRELATQFALPQIRALVDKAPVDLLMHEQGWLFLNDLNYAPRPVFQGYAAYTPRLAKLNEAKLLAPEGAPEFLLLKLQAIDAHLPTSEDPLSVLALMRRYRPVTEERGFVLLKRTDEAAIAPIDWPENAWIRARTNSEIAIDTKDRPMLLRLDVRPNWMGRLYSAVYREPELWLDIGLQDGSMYSHRIVRNSGMSGFLVSPHFASTRDYIRWYAGTYTNRVVSIRVRSSRPALTADDLRYSVLTIDLPRAAASPLAASLRAYAYPGFSEPPIAQSGDVSNMQEGNHEVLSMHAPAGLTFALAEGRWKARGLFGIRSAAYDLETCADADGVELLVQRDLGSGRYEIVWRRALDPFRIPADRGEQILEFGPFESDGVHPLDVRFNAGPSAQANLACDWAYLRELNFERVAN